jgi:hypothetical protein
MHAHLLLIAPTATAGVQQQTSAFTTRAWALEMQIVLAWT